MNGANIPAALSRLPWSTVAPTIAPRRITDDCAAGKADTTVYAADTSYDFGDELFSI